MNGNGHRELVSEVPITASLGAAVRSRRFRLGYSQEELAERADLHRTYIASIEGGGRNVTLKSIQKIARALETSVARLLSECEAPAERGTVSMLLVEDDAGDLDLTLKTFHRARLNNEIHVVRDGEEALDFLFGRGPHAGRRGEPPPHLMLLDLTLPGIHGLEVLRQLKADKVMRMIHVILMSASLKDDSCREALRLGAVGCLVKPVDFQDFCRITPQLSLSWLLFRETEGQ